MAIDSQSQTWHLILVSVCSADNFFFQETKDQTRVFPIIRHSQIWRLQRAFPSRNILGWVILAILARLGSTLPDLALLSSHQLSTHARKRPNSSPTGVCSCAPHWFRWDGKAKPSSSLSWVRDVSHPWPWEVLSSLVFLPLPSSFSFISEEWLRSVRGL